MFKIFLSRYNEFYQKRPLSGTEKCQIFDFFVLKQPKLFIILRFESTPALPLNYWSKLIISQKLHIDGKYYFKIYVEGEQFRKDHQ